MLQEIRNTPRIYVRASFTARRRARTHTCCLVDRVHGIVRDNEVDSRVRGCNQGRGSNAKGVNDAIKEKLPPRDTHCCTEIQVDLTQRRGMQLGMWMNRKGISRGCTSNFHIRRCINPFATAASIMKLCSMYETVHIVRHSVDEYIGDDYLVRKSVEIVAGLYWSG